MVINFPHGNAHFPAAGCVIWQGVLFRVNHYPTIAPGAWRGIDVTKIYSRCSPKRLVLI